MLREQKSTPKVVPFFLKKAFFYGVGIAAMFAVLLMVYVQQDQKEVDFSTLANTEIETYIEDEIENMYAIDIINYLSDNRGLDTFDYGSSNIRDEVIINYLTLENWTDEAIIE